MTTKSLSYFYFILYTFFLFSCEKNSQQSFNVTAGEDIAIPSNTQFYFGGKTTTDPEKLTSIKWEQLTGIPVIINNAETLMANFLSPQVFFEQKLSFQIHIENEAGKITTDSIEIRVYPITDLQNAEFSFNQLPQLSSSFILSITSEKHFGNLRWKLTKGGVQIQNEFELSNDNKSFTYTPDKPGAYQIKITSDMSEAIRTVRFYVQQKFPFLKEKIKGYDGSIPAEKLIGEIINQSWVRSSTLSKTALIQVIEQYPAFRYLGFDELKGVLIEYEETDEKALTSLSEIKKIKGVKQVYNRLHEGPLTPKIESLVYETNDYNAWDDLPSGDNWHLEKIQAPKAWAINTGNPEILIGISDGGFKSSHEELQGRVNQELTQTDNVVFMDHGNGVAGTIAAIANNNKGVAGINWQSQIVLASNDYDSILALSNHPKIRVISSSWAIPGYIPETFNPNDARQISLRRNEAIKATRIYRTLAQKNPDKLYIWSSGNGINNGKGYKDIFGIEGQYHSPALHFSDDGDVSYQDNVLFVSATDKNNRLYYYSNYGNLVEIVAPSHFKSLTAVDYKKFLGTSAATPVVAGVASLIFSLNPEFTGKEVKDILITSAIKSIDQRSKTPQSRNGEQINKTPLLNAYEAMKEANKRLNYKFRFLYDIPDPFSSVVFSRFIPFQKKNRIIEVSGNLYKKNNDDWQASAGFHDYQASLSINFEPVLDPQKLVSSVRVETADKEQIVIELENNIPFAKISINAKDQLTDARISNLKLSIENLDNDNTYKEGRTDQKGQATLWLKPGHYKIDGQALGFKATSQKVKVNAQDDQAYTLSLFPSESEGFGGLDGIVTDLKGEPLAHAVLQLAHGNKALDIYKLTTTDNNGFYQFIKIPSIDEEGLPIKGFQLNTIARGYMATSEKINIVSAITRTKNIALSIDKSAVGKFFIERVETPSNWKMSGMWHRTNLEASQIYNKIADRGFSLMPSNNAQKIASLPKAASEKFAFWYGDENSGSYINTQSNDDYPTSGGTSESTHTGSLISPPINLIDIDNPSLIFKTWWEVEALSPGREKFDRMEVWVSTNAGVTYERVKVLNPQFSAHILHSTDKPFSSSGFDKEPTWVDEIIDLSSYKDDIITIKFVFDTKDRYANGFRGWLIDDLEIINVNR